MSSSQTPRRLAVAVVVGLAAFGPAAGVARAGQPTGDATADVETTPVLSTGDAADDPAIWVHPGDPSLSLVIGTDKRAALEVYDLAGRRLQRITGGTPNNVDVRRGFILGGRSVDIAGVSDPSTGTLRFYAIDASTRRLSDVTARTIGTGIGASGFCLYRSVASGMMYAFHTATGGRVAQWRLFERDGKVDAVQVRGPWSVGGAAEGCVADDELGSFYLAEEDVGIWKYGAEPGQPTTSRTLVDTTAAGGHLTADVEGLTLVYQPEGTGYLMASAQAASTGDPSYFTLYERQGDNAFVRRFQVVSGVSADGCSRTDGIDAVAGDLGPSFPSGLFACQDFRNTLPGGSGNQNFKFVRLEKILDVDGPSPPLPPSGSITFRASAASGPDGARMSVTVATPAGTQAGDVMIASVTVNDDDVVSAPAGWSLVRQDVLTDALRQAVYWKAAAASEPPSHTWIVPNYRRVAAGISTYTGVDANSPVEAHGAITDGTGNRDVEAPSITTRLDGMLLVHLASISAEGTIASPDGMSERWEEAAVTTTSNRDVLVSSSDELRPAAGPTGPRTATATNPGKSIGALLALRPAT